MKSDQALNLLTIARSSGKRPSELVEIDCSYCAYCFDEALFVREALRLTKKTEREQGEAQIIDLQQKIRERA